MSSLILGPCVCCSLYKCPFLYPAPLVTSTKASALAQLSLPLGAASCPYCGHPALQNHSTCPENLLFGHLSSPLITNAPFHRFESLYCIIVGTRNMCQQSDLVDYIICSQLPFPPLSCMFPVGGTHKPPHRPWA